MNYRFKQSIFELSKTEYIQEDWYYKVYTETEHHFFLKRSDAYDYYKHSKGTRIDIIYKDNNDGVKTIVNCPNMNLEDLREDFSIRKTPKNKRKAIANYNKKNTKQIAFVLNKNTDKDILEYLDKIDNKQGLIKELLREHIEKENNKYNYIIINNQICERRHKYREYKVF